MDEVNPTFLALSGAELISGLHQSRGVSLTRVNMLTSASIRHQHVACPHQGLVTLVHEPPHAQRPGFALV
ncbi:hypothetical protein RRG08_012519 [Elysia crispata]|uniref:Uncharacterized protein n=1 Tax=Elysia crispata TaxID=231223 RepID=A0AAE1APG0_9GAST|nr:hypothetical protein RRG08_012519 [Elysia crispata]